MQASEVPPGIADPVVLITGGARRVGAAIARHLHAAGWRVIIHYRRSAEDAQALAGKLNRARPDSAALVCGDLNAAEVCGHIAEQALNVWGRLDGLINNASTFRPTPVGKTTEKDWDSMASGNLKGPFFLLQAAAPHLRETGGAVVNLADIYADRPLADHAAYNASKAGMVALTRSLARDLAPEVRVNAVAPGAILWPENNPNENHRARILNNVPLARSGTPEDIAHAVAFLLSAQSGYITGQILAVDGGRSVVPA